MAKKLSVEEIKQQSRYLRGTLKEALQDGSTHFSEENIQVMKFHGMYQQDDRDLRRQLSKEGKERHYMMMIRARIPGGILSAEQYLQFDRLAELYGNGTMRITTRQTFQLHGILKENLKQTVKSINDVLITTLGGCGDQVRNTIGCAAPHKGRFYEQVREDILKIVDRLSAKSNAYHEIWLDGEQVNLNGEADEEPIYGKLYLPRKFKIGFTYEGDNCSDIYANDIGIVAHNSGDQVEGYTILAGGGMGRTATDKETSPFLAAPLGYVDREDLVEACVAIVKVQRDNGNREERKFARMKYLIAKNGMAWFKAETEKYLGKSIAAPRKLTWESAHDHYGWHQQDENKGYLGIFVQNGRIIDTESIQLKSVLKEIMETFKPTVHLTTQQNLILADLSTADYQAIASKLEQAGVSLPEACSHALLNSMACPSMPTCGLGLAESERALPGVIPQIEQLLKQLGIEDQSITIRMTGCANGCARPYLAELGFVGRAPGKYDVFLGASANGDRLNTLFKEMVPYEQLADTLKPLLTAYVQNRTTGEGFGDYCRRIGTDGLLELAAVH